MPTRTKAAAHSAVFVQLPMQASGGGSWGQWQHSGGLLGLQEYPALLHGCGAVSHPAGQWGRHPCKAPRCHHFVLAALLGVATHAQQQIGHHHHGSPGAVRQCL